MNIYAPHACSFIKDFQRDLEYIGQQIKGLRQILASDFNTPLSPKEMKGGCVIERLHIHMDEQDNRR